MTPKPEEASPELTREAIERHRDCCVFEACHSQYEHTKRHYRELAQICDMALHRERYREALAELVRTDDDLRYLDEMGEADPAPTGPEIMEVMERNAKAWSAARALLEEK